MMDRKTWLERILSVIHDLSDAAYQERVWIRGQGRETDSSTEAICRLFDDYDLAGFLSACQERAWLPDDELEALKAFEAAMSDYLAHDDDRMDDAARIASPQWQELRRRAEGTLATFAAAHPVDAR